MSPLAHCACHDYSLQVTIQSTATILRPRINVTRANHFHSTTSRFSRVSSDVSQSNNGRAGRDGDEGSGDGEGA